MVGVMPLESKTVYNCSEQTNIQTRSGVMAKMPVFAFSLSGCSAHFNCCWEGKQKNCGPAADKLKHNQCNQAACCGSLSQKLAFRH